MNNIYWHVYWMVHLIPWNSLLCVAFWCKTGVGRILQIVVVPTKCMVLKNCSGDHHITILSMIDQKRWTLAMLTEVFQLCILLLWACVIIIAGNYICIPEVCEHQSGCLHVVARSAHCTCCMHSTMVPAFYKWYLLSFVIMGWTSLSVDSNPLFL